MGHRAAKKARKLVYGTGAEAQAKKHSAGYSTINKARPVEVVLTFDKPVEVMNCFFKTVTAKKEVSEKTLFTPEGTRECVGLRQVYKALKRGAQA